MAKSRIDEALAALNAGGNDGFGARREVLERLGLDLLHRPALGSQIVARICAITEPSPRDEDLLELLGAGLDAARIARENGKERGQNLIDSVEAALGLARGQGRMTSAHSLLFAQLWTRNGLPAPIARALQVEEVVPAAGRRASNAAEGDALLEGLFTELIKQAKGEPLALHHALTESFPAMPPEMRDHVVAYSVGRSDPLHADMACYWLPRINPSQFQRFMDLLMMRAQTVSDVASVPDQLIAAISSRSKKGQVEWWSGFSDATNKFRTAWPKKNMSKEDGRLFEIVAGGFVSADLTEFAALIAQRQERNIDYGGPR